MKTFLVSAVFTVDTPEDDQAAAQRVADWLHDAARTARLGTEALQVSCYDTPARPDHSLTEVNPHV